MGMDSLRAPVIRIALGCPWYAGADRDTVAPFLIQSHYFGRLQERLNWLVHYPLEASSLPPLDPMNPKASIPDWMIGKRIEFGLIDEVGCSLPGTARENIVRSALTWGADYILFFDADMMFGTHTLLRLLEDDKPVVAALAFTGREPITPVIYDFTETLHPAGTAAAAKLEINIKPQLDYKRDSLYEVDAIGGGVMLIHTSVFKEIPSPWFSVTGMGEDIYFCFKCREYGIPVFVDTRVKTAHKPTFAYEWHSEVSFDRQQKSERRILLKPTRSQAEDEALEAVK